MEDCRFLVLLLVLGFFLGSGSLAYSPDTTHPALSDEMVDFFNLHFPNQALNNVEKKIIIQGSHDEDAFGRWMYHFYDPVYERGVQFGVRWESSKRWAQDHKLQAKRDPKMLAAGALLRPFSGSSDYSWERSIYEYAWGDKKRGLKGLGQILHLIQDASVPDHTRDDPHPPLFEMGSPYEKWTAQFTPEELKVVPELRSQKLIKLGSLNEYFNGIATYSNKNFFSKDTIFSERYENPIVQFERKETLSNGRDVVFGYNVELGKVFRIVGRYVESEWTSELENTKPFIVDRDYKILSDYWNLLSKQAVLHGAGVIKLFFDEVEKEKRTERLLAYNKSPTDRLIGAVAALFSPTKRLQQEGVLTKELEFKEEVDEGEKRVEREKGEEGDEGEQRGLPAAPVVRPPSQAQLPQLAEVLPEPPQVVQQPEEEQGEKREKGEQREEGEKGGIGGGSTGGGGGGGGGSSSSGSSSTSSTTAKPATPDITSPANLSTPFTNATINFSGTSTAGALITTDFSSATTSAATDDTWSLQLTLPQGTTTVSFFAEKSGAKSSAKTISVGVDTSGPTLSNFKITECSNSLATNGCLVATTTLNLVWDSSSDAVDYTLECSTCGDDFPVTLTATSTTVTVPALATHTFTLKSKDSLNNESTLASEQVEINLRPVVINEVAWMGTEAHFSDEWIELFNTSGFTVNLGDGTATSSWILAAADGTPNIILNGTVESKGFFLLERTASTTTSLDEDQVYTTGALGDPGEILSLKTPAGLIIDELDANQSAGGWQNIGDKTVRRTAERINPFHSGIFPYNWRTASTTSSTLDADGNAIKGTPKTQNSAYNENWRPTLITDSTVISTNTTWYATGSPYILESNAGEIPTVAAGTTLTIESDVVLMALSSSHQALKVEGTLKAIGNATNEITFTFFDDADYGGVTLGEKGKWRGISFSAASAGSALEYVRFRYAGAGTPPTTTVEAASGASIEIKNSRFESNKGLVFNLDGNNFGGVVIKDSTFESNGIPALADDAAILLKNGANPTINNNTFSANDYPPVKIISAYPTIGTNAATSNFLNGIYVDDATIISTNTTWASSLPYLLESNSGVRATVATGTTLTIEPGVILKPINKNYEAFRVEGTLVWGGAATSSVLTSQYDDDFGGDSNNDGATTTSPALGDWIDFHFMPGSVGTFTNVKFLYGSGGAEPSQPGLKVDSGATVTLTGVEFGP